MVYGDVRIHIDDRYSFGTCDVSDLNRRDEFIGKGEDGDGSVQPEETY